MVYHRFLVLAVLFFSTTLYAFDHEYRDYGVVLGKHVKNGLVNYAALKKDRKGIDQFVRQVAAVTDKEYQSWSREQQLTYWINTYNGWFLQIVIDRYPIRGGRLLGVFYPENSVQRIPGLWDDIKTKAAGREVSLNEIEHKILRPVFKEPRIHFSIVCASIGCPLLRSEPFRVSSLQKQLDDAARDFVNNPAKVNWNDAEKRLKLSKIFDWFSDDFESAGGPVAFVSRYMPERVAKILKATKVKVEYLDYDWSLNEYGAQASSLHYGPQPSRLPGAGRMPAIHDAGETPALHRNYKTRRASISSWF